MRLRNDINSEQDNLLRFLDFHKERVRRKELAAGTVKNYYTAVKLFCEMNDVSLNWKKISRGLPRVKKSSNDRAPTLEELRKLVDYPDRRPLVDFVLGLGIIYAGSMSLRYRMIISH